MFVSQEGAASIFVQNGEGFLSGTTEQALSLLGRIDMVSGDIVFIANAVGAARLTRQRWDNVSERLGLNEYVAVLPTQNAGAMEPGSPLMLLRDRLLEPGTLEKVHYAGHMTVKAVLHAGQPGVAFRLVMQHLSQRDEVRREQIADLTRAMGTAREAFPVVFVGNHSPSDAIAQDAARASRAASLVRSIRIAVAGQGQWITEARLAGFVNDWTEGVASPRRDALLADLLRVGTLSHPVISRAEQLPPEARPRPGDGPVQQLEQVRSIERMVYAASLVIDNILAKSGRLDGYRVLDPLPGGASPGLVAQFTPERTLPKANLSSI